MSVIIDGTNGISDVDGSASTPAIRGTDANTGIFFPAADTIAFAEGGTESMRLDSSGNVGIGTSSPATKLHVNQTNDALPALQLQHGDGDFILMEEGGGTDLFKFTRVAGTNDLQINNITANNIRFATNNTERMRIDSSGKLLVGCTTEPNNTVNGFKTDINYTIISAFQQPVLYINRNGNDGGLVDFRQDNSSEGNISVSGTTVSYNGGHLSRWAQMLTKPDLFKGTVMSNLDEMNVYVDKDGNPVDNEQLNKVKVSDVEGDVNVAGVFVNWSHDEQHNVDEINMAMTGDMIIRIAQGVVVQRGDLLMSAGDGTAKPQGDDIVRSKTIAKVTSNNVTCTYEDGSYCVPCVLMAC
jgi:hypothetical protein